MRCFPSVRVAATVFHRSIFAFFALVLASLAAECQRLHVLPRAFPPVLGFQAPSTRESPAGKIDAVTALNRALKASSLTFEGKPFHAEMEIETAGEPYSGRIEFWWVNPSMYRVVVTSPKFKQVKTKNGDRIQENDDGDYYPRWLENFVLAVLDPLPMAKDLSENSSFWGQSSQNNYGCLRRDDRTNGITDQLTYAQICFSGSEPRVESVRAFNEFMHFKDWQTFGEKQIPRTYQTNVLDEDPVVGRLVKLEVLTQPDDAMFTIDSVTPFDQRISSSFVSTQVGETLVETVPTIQWPTVRDGKTEGYMLVYVRTDRTGQVRETALHDSGQSTLGSVGMQEAMKYKFKPLIVDGVPQQIEMPLVIHFSTKLNDLIPVLSVGDMARQTISCKPDAFKPGLLPKGTVVTVQVTVDAGGKAVEVTPVGRCPVGCGLILGPVYSVKKCQFAPYIVNGRATTYKGNVELIAP